MSSETYMEIDTSDSKPEARLKHSSEIGELGKALASAGLEFDSAVKDTSNPFFKSKYADLAELIRATRPALSKHGLVVIQSPRVNERSACVTTMLLHSSGQWLSDELELPAAQGTKFDAQTVGSAITYARRYAYQSILNIAGEVDDDGNAASHTKEYAKIKAENEEFNQLPEAEKRITQEQAMAFVDACKKSGKTDAQVAAKLETFGYLQVGQIKRGQWMNAIKWANTVQSPDNPEKMVEAIKDSVRDVKIKKMFAVANKKKVPEQDLKVYVVEAFAIDSFTKLSIPQIDRVIEWVEAQTA